MRLSRKRFVKGENSSNCRVLVEAMGEYTRPQFRGIQRQFSENICSEDDLRSRIFGTFVAKISCVAACPRIFEHLKNGVIAHF